MKMIHFQRTRQGLLLLLFLNVLLSFALSACVTKPEASLSSSNPSTSIRVHWEWDSTTGGCIRADDISIKYALTNRDQCIPISNSPQIPVDVQGPDRHVQINSLEPYSTYTISYKFYLGGAVVHDSHEVIQTDPGSLGIPVGIQNVDKSSTHLTFTWSPVPCGKRHGPISSYNLRLSEAENPGIFKFHKNVHVDTLEWTFSEMDPSTEYVFVIQSIALTSGGLVSEFSTPLHVWTDGTNIPAPSSVSVSNNDLNFVFTWTPVQCFAIEACSSVIGYKYKLVSADGTDARMEVVQTGTHVTLPGLPCVEYTFQVSAITDAGIGRMSNRRTATIRALPEPPNVHAPDADINSVIIEWDAPNLHGPCADLKITGYKIEIAQGISRQNFDVPVVYQHEFSDLTGYQNYVIRIKTIGEAGQESPWSQNISTFTKEGVSSKPRNVTATKITPSSITIEWNTPRYSNGDITYYDVQLTPKDQFDTSLSIIQRIRHTNLDSLKINFPDLLPNTTYIFSIRANKDDDSLIGEEETFVATTGIENESKPVGVYVGIVIATLVVIAVIGGILVIRFGDGCGKLRKTLEIYGLLMPQVKAQRHPQRQLHAQPQRQPPRKPPPQYQPQAQAQPQAQPHIQPPAQPHAQHQAQPQAQPEPQMYVVMGISHHQ